MKKIIIENLKTIIYALIIAVLIRSILLQPFYIPSSSMEPVASSPPMGSIASHGTHGVSRVRSRPARNDDQFRQQREYKAPPANHGSLKSICRPRAKHGKPIYDV